MRLKIPLRVRLTGLAFYDRPHGRRNESMVGHNHGSKRVSTPWELHPVWDIGFIEN